MKYPDVVRNTVAAFDQRLPWVSIDFEFPWGEPFKPSIVGLSSGAAPFSGFYDDKCRDELARLEKKGVTWVGHNSLTVEKAIIESELGVKIPVERCDDTMLQHYLCNAELCKGTTKGGEDDEDEGISKDKRGMGFMDLWSMASLYTRLPQWKQCRGTHCTGPCRIHDVLGYNGLDALAADVAEGALRADMAAKQIPDGLYQHLKKLTILCHAMEVQGIHVDRVLVAKLEKDFEERKGKLFPYEMKFRIGKKGQTLTTQEIVWDAPFNPRSPQQIIDWFKSKNVSLGAADKEEIQSCITHLSDKTEPEVRQWLETLYDYKSEGKGLGPWFAERYFGADGLMHPRFITTGSSMGRLSSANPNFQNIPRVGFGKNVRGVVVPRDESLILVKADKSQLELRVCLWYSGVLDKLPKDVDAFKWMVEHGQGLFEQAAMIVGHGKSPRDLTKSVSHGGDYLEGVKVFYAKDLDMPRTKSAIAQGALVIHRNWEYAGGVVGFTGVNLAERLFGSANFENRRKALEIQESYFGRFWEIRENFHKKIVTASAERGWCRSSSGRYLVLIGSPEDKMKMAAAFYGQGGGADDVQEAMVRYGEMGHTPLIQVHDELVFEFPRGVSNDKLFDFFSIFSMPSKFMPGFACPVKVSRGDNWLTMEEIGKI